MARFKKICVTCGTEYPPRDAREICDICAEERQYIPEQGQLWTAHSIMEQSHKVKMYNRDRNLIELKIEPKFAIGQRAFLVHSEEGNILWDCIPMLDQTTIEFITQIGGIRAIALSHPHYYSNMAQWAETFDCPIFVHQADWEHIVYPSDRIELWKGKHKKLWDGMFLYNLGGHFDGGSVLMLPNHSEEGTMLCSDILQIAPSKKFIAMMYSYPNNIPLPLNEVRRMKTELDELSFGKLYGAFDHQNMTENVKEILDRSIERYFE